MQFTNNHGRTGHLVLCQEDKQVATGRGHRTVRATILRLLDRQTGELADDATFPVRQPITKILEELAGAGWTLATSETLTTQAQAI